jgi:hypothetical protein
MFVHFLGKKRPPPKQQCDITEHRGVGKKCPWWALGSSGSPSGMFRTALELFPQTCRDLQGLKINPTCEIPSAAITGIHCNIHKHREVEYLVLDHTATNFHLLFDCSHIGLGKEKHKNLISTKRLVSLHPNLKLVSNKMSL